MKPKVKSSQIVYSGFLKIREDQLQRQDGLVHSYSSLILDCDAAVILAKDQKGLWILNREYRHPTGEILLGPPGGRLEPGEDPLIGGQREFFEETGYWSDEVHLLGTSYPFPGVCNQKIFYLFAKNAYRKGEQKLDPFEFIETVLLTNEELEREIKEKSAVDSLLLSALWYSK